MKKIKQISDDFIEVDGVKYYKVQPEPTTPRWEDLDEVKGWYVNNTSDIIASGGTSICFDNRNTFPTRKHAEASIALAQLLQLRDSKFYRNGWKPDWSDSEQKYFVGITDKGLVVDWWTSDKQIFSFETPEMAEKFMTEQKDLLEIFFQLHD